MTAHAAGRWRDDEDFKASCFRWAERIGVDAPEIRFGAMRGKWATCSLDRVLAFNPDLLSVGRCFGEAVIVHELLHLKVPNHGPVFRALLETYLPGAGRWLQRGPSAAEQDEM